MQKPKNKDRKTKLYEKDHIKNEVKKGKGKTIKIASNVNIRAGAINGLKTRTGWIGEAIGASLNLKDNIMEGEPISKIGGDLGVDAGVGVIFVGARGVAAGCGVV